jgi:hypothetical protein
MPVTPGDVVRVYTEAGTQQPRKYQPGMGGMPVTLVSLILLISIDILQENRMHRQKNVRA